MRLLIAVLAMLTARSAVAIPPAPEWVVNERNDGFTISMERAPWVALPPDGEGQVVIRATGATLTRRVGWPELPVYHLLFAVPPGCEPVLRFDSRSTRQHALRAAPVGEWSMTERGYAVARENQVPAPMTGALYPAHCATIEPWGQFRGVGIWALDIRPLQQRLGTAEVVEHVGITAHVSWDPATERRGPPIEERYVPALRSMVINDDAAARVGTVAFAPVAAPWEPPYPAVKITTPPGRPAVIRQEDLASVAPDLAALGSEELALWWMGNPLPCAIDTTDGTRARICFVSPALPPEYANETFHNSVWLGRGSGLVPMALRSAVLDPNAPLVSSHPVTLTAAEELEHSDYTVQGDALQWWWAHTETRSPGQVSSTNLSVGLSVVDKTKPLTLSLAASADSWATHRLRLSIATRVLADTTWTGKGDVIITAAVPDEVVYVGTNVVKVDAIGQSSSSDIIRIRSLALSFSTGTAAMDSLRFAGAHAMTGPHRYRVEGFRSSAVEVFEVSDPSNPIRLTGAAVEAAAGGYAVTFADSVFGDPARQYLAFAVDRGASRPVLERVTAGVLQSATGADYLAITHPLFIEEAERLAAHRRSRGMNALVIDVNEVYDRFGFGYPSSRAIDDFIAWAHGAFNPRPGFVVLIGDGSARQRHGNQISPNLIPVRLITRTADENAYADVDEDPRRLPDLAIGRLSVQTVEQARSFVDKIIAAETQSGASPAHAKITLFADDESGVASQPGFAFDCEQIVTSIRPAYFPERIYLSYNGGSNDAWSDRPTMLHARAKGETYYRPWILNAIRNGTLVFTYVGHGGVNTLATEWIITTDDAPEMLTSPNYPLMTSFSCDTGRFDDPDYDIIMAEHFTRWREGALAFFSSSRASYPYDNRILSVNLHRALLDDRIRQVGLAAQVAKIQSDISYVCRVYSLLGDPASELPVPSVAGLAAEVVPDVVTSGAAVAGSLTWSAASADVMMELVDAFGIPLNRTEQTLALPWSGALATAEAPPPGQGALRVWARSGATEGLTYARFTSPVNVDTAIVTPQQGSGGYVASSNGNLLVSIPAECVDDTTVVRVTPGFATLPGSQRHVDVCPVPGSGAGRAYQVRFDSGEPGRAPLSLRVAYDTNWVLPADVESLMVAAWDQGMGLWVGLPTTVSGGRAEAMATTTGQFTVLVVYDRQPPIMPSVEIQDGAAWRVFQEGEFAASGEWMRANLADEDGIAGSSVRLDLDGRELDFTYEASSPYQDARIFFQLPDLPAGVHRVVLRAADVYGNEAAHALTIRTGAGFAIASFAAVPSPFNESTTFRFVLSNNASYARATIHTVGGRLIRSLDVGSPTRGTNLLPWDGRDEDGDRIAGGVYLVRLVVDDGHARLQADTKVVRRPS